MYEINFIPENIKKKQSEKYFIIKIIITTSLLLSLLIIAFYFPSKISRRLEDTEKTLEAKYKAVESQKNIYGNKQKTYFEAIKLIKKQKHYNGECITNVTKYLSPNMVIENIRYDSSGLVLMGNSREYLAIVKLDELLNKTKTYRNIRLTNIEYNTNTSNYSYLINIEP